MANDVHDQLFSEERQLYIGDAANESEVEVAPLPVAAPAVEPVTTSSALGGMLFPTMPDSTAGAPKPTTSRRRRKALERAQKIIYYLESKYDVLYEVCSSFENWKEATSASADFDVLWCDTAIQADRFVKLKPYQKMNHFVGMNSITRKNNLGRNLLRMRKQFPKEYRFFPDTWILPTDLSDFKNQFHNGKSNKTFIIKPENGCQGRGIFLIRDIEKVPADFSTSHVAQRYINKPFLLDGYKFDLRLYVLVMGCDPLRVFLHRQGLVRLASEKYVEPTGKNLSDSTMHLTNYAINKDNPNFEENQNPEDAHDGHKRSWQAVQSRLRAMGYNIDHAIAEIEDLIVKTLIAVQPSLAHFYHSCQPDDVENAMCFEVLGFDVMLDHKLQPWLLEVNHAPSFGTDSELDQIVKTEVLTDTFVLQHFSPELRRQKKRELREKMEQRTLGLAKKRDLKEQLVLAQELAIERTVWENENLGGYKRLYPSEESEQQYMAIHDAAIGIWEMLMGGTSRRSVRLSAPRLGPDDGTEAGSEVGERPHRPGQRRNSSQRSQNSAEKRSGKKSAKEKSSRTAEELKEVVERLTAGVSARPRPSEKSTTTKDAGPPPPEMPPPPPEPEPAADATAQVVSEEAVANIAAPVEQQKPPSLATETPRPPPRPPHPDVRVGDVVKVQTNLGWESVVIRLKRSNGRVDIQFKDGEYMRSVMPRILKENGAPAIVRESNSTSESGGGGGNAGASRGATATVHAAPNEATLHARSSPDTAVVVAGRSTSSTRGDRSASPPLPGLPVQPPSPVVSSMLGNSSNVVVGASVLAQVSLAPARGRDASPAAHPMRLGGRVRGGAPWPGASTATNSIGNRGLVRGSGVLQGGGSVSTTPRTSVAPEADLQQHFKHLFRVRTVNM